MSNPSGAYPSKTGPAAAKAAPAQQDYSRNYPQFEALLATGSPELLEKIEKTCRQLDELARNGSAQDKLRAGSALSAYARALELYKHLAEIRNAVAANQTQPERPPNR